MQVLKGALDAGSRVRITADTGMLEYRITNKCVLSVDACAVSVVIK
jgi:hypothetical protein